MSDTRESLLDDLRKQREDLKLPSLLKRGFEPISKTAADKLSSFRVMQWNLLAQALSTGDDNFVMCPAEALVWDNRKLHILEEILTYDATVVCVEEVDHFTYMCDTLSKAGYNGCFFAKPDSPCLYTPDNSGPDGCSVFWKTEELELLDTKNINLYMDSGEKTNQVAVLCKFSHKLSKNNFFVAVTHLKSKKPYFQERHQQGKYLEQVLLQQTEGSPLILCGDFNAEPTEKVYETFRSSKLNLKSAYCHLSVDMEEPRFTTWMVRGVANGRKREVAHCIDYMFYSWEHLQPVSVLKMPAEAEIGENRLPSFAYPSDHLSLVVDFVFNG